MGSDSAAAAVTTKVRIPASLRRFTEGRDEISATGQTVAEVLQDLYRQCPGLQDLLLDSRGLRRFVNLYVGQNDIRFLNGLETKLGVGDTLTILAGIAGG